MSSLRQQRRIVRKRNPPHPRFGSFLGQTGVPRTVMETAQVSTYRQVYIAQSAGTFTVSGKQLLDWVCVAATATAAYRCFASLRLKSIEVWSPIIASTTSNTGTLPASVSIEQYGPTAGYENSRKQIAVALGTEPAYLKMVPPKDSSLAFWRQSGSSDGDSTDTILAIAGQLGFVVRLSIDVKLVDDESVYGTATATAGATVGKVYYSCLDGRTSGQLIPLGVNILP